MVITIILISAVAFVAAILGTIIHQKALAYEAYRCGEDALSELPLRRRTANARQALPRQATRLRSAALARRKATNACGHHAYS